ncbi:MAG TPA: hypothetical protein VFS27_03185 [Blastocatellia bacterium]|jgi:hypothetical protein|nr:hypothetical protein [Blastocatellia bacterium]
MKPLSYPEAGPEVGPEAGPEAGKDACAPRAQDAAVNDDRVWLLCRGVKSLIRCDEAEVISGIARYVVSKHAGLRLLSALIELSRRTLFPPLIALVGAMKSFLAVRSLQPRDPSNGVVWIARLGNERRAIEPMIRSFPELDWAELKFRRRPEPATLFALTGSFVVALRRLLRMARILDRRYEFFRTLRVGELLAYYKRYLGIFQNARFGLAVTSNHSNPHGIAFNLAARRCGVPVVLITHGLPVRPIARLSYDMAVVHCEAARQAYLQEGCRMDRVFIHGRRQDYAPMPTDRLPDRVSVGIFLCKEVNEERLRALVGRLLDDPRVSRILVRPHPTNLWANLWANLRANLRADFHAGPGARVAGRNDPRLSLSAGGPVSVDLEASDIVLAGNSSVLVEAVTAGRPSGYAPGLDYGSPDLHSFVARGLIYAIDDDLSFDPDAMLRFYRQPGWIDTLRFFANIDEDAESVAARAGAAMRELLSARGQKSFANVRGAGRPVNSSELHAAAAQEIGARSHS